MTARNPTQPKGQKQKLTTAIPGPKSQTLRAREEVNLAPGLQRFALMAGIVVDHAEGSTITDVDGNTLIDIIGGIGVNGLGHSHPKLVRELEGQLKKISVGSFTSEPRVKLLEKLSEHRPAPDVYRTQLYSSGAEAVESALRLAKCFTGKFEFVSFWGGFHGKTMGVLSLMGSDFKEKLGPMVSGSHIVPYAYCYRCPLNLKYPTCGLACADMAREQIKKSSAGEIAAFLIEPQQGAFGNIAPPHEFLPAVQSIAKDFGALFIVDEMITGFGRTGKYWGAQHSGVKPDVVTIGKQFGGGFPITGVISRDEIVNAKPWSNPSGSSSSYGGNPLGSAAAASSLEIIDEEDLVENSRLMGEYFKRKLEPFLDEYPFVGEVRGLGLLLAIELVKDKQTKDPLPSSVTYQIFDACLRRGLLCMAYESKFRIQPALTIDEKTIDHAVEIIREVFDWVKREEVWKR